MEAELREGVAGAPPADLEPSSVVLRGAGAFVVRGHVVQVAAVFMAAVV